MQIFKGLIHKAEAATAALSGDLQYGSQSLADEDDCRPKSLLFSRLGGVVPPAVRSAVPSSSSFPASRPGRLVPGGGGDGACHCTHCTGHPGTAAPAERTDNLAGKNTLLQPCFPQEHTAAPCTHFLQLKHKLLLHRPL